MIWDDSHHMYEGPKQNKILRDSQSNPHSCLSFKYFIYQTSTDQGKLMIETKFIPEKGLIEVDNK